MDVVRAARGARRPGGAVPPAHAARRERRMNAILTVARRELKALFDHPTAYILLVVFTSVNGFLFFREVDMYGVASLRPMLDLLPWLLLFLAPAVTMRALAEDSRSGTLEVVLAQPFTELELLAGKSLGQLSVLVIALAMTLTLPLGLALGAHLPVGVLVAQYVGATLLIAGLAAVGIWASSVTSNQITAFILAVAVMFVLILVGLDPLIVGLPPRLGAIAASLGVLSHFTGIDRGVIDLRDAAYFVTLAALFLLLAYFALMRRKLTARGASLQRLRLGTVLLAAAMIVVNLFGRHIGGRIDLTPGRSYTLAPATKRILGALPDLVTIKLFATSALPPQVAFLKRDLDDLLRDYRAAGRGAIVAQQIVQVAFQERHLGRERARGEQLDGHEVGQGAEDPLRGGGERVRPARRQVDPAADVASEQVHHDHRRREQDRPESQALQRRAARRELAPHQREVGEQQEERGERNEVSGVPQVDHTAVDAGEMRQHAERRGDRAEAGRQAHDQGIEPDQNQHEHHRDGEDERGDLVAGDARRPDADGGEPRDQERSADVLRHEHPDREMRSQGEAEREGERHGQRDHEDRQLTEVLAGQKLELRDGLRQHH